MVSHGHQSEPVSLQQLACPWRARCCEALSSAAMHMAVTVQCRRRGARMTAIYHQCSPETKLKPIPQAFISISRRFQHRHKWRWVPGCQLLYCTVHSPPASSSLMLFGVNFVVVLKLHRNLREWDYFLVTEMWSVSKTRSKKLWVQVVSIIEPCYNNRIGTVHQFQILAVSTTQDSSIYDRWVSWHEKAYHKNCTWGTGQLGVFCLPNYYVY